MVAACAWLTGCNTAHAATLLTDTFSDGDRTNHPAWFISQGSFNVAFGEANNNNSSANQFFTTAFAPTRPDDQQGLRVTLSYRPEGLNLSSVRVGVFAGDPPAADSWDQWNPGNPTRAWRGYVASIAVNGSSATEIRRNDNDTDNHAFFAGAMIGSPGTTLHTAGSSVFRWIRFELYRRQEAMVLEVFEGPTQNDFVSLGQVTDEDALMDDFRNLALYQTTSGGNGHIRYDNITLETFSTAHAVEPPVLSIHPAGAGHLLVTLSNVTVGQTYEVRTGPFMDIDTYTVVDRVTATNTAALATFPAIHDIAWIWGVATNGSAMLDVAAHRDYGTWRSSIFGGGGYLQHIVFAPSQPNRMYSYVDVGGVYRSDDAGRTWRMMHGGMPVGDGYYSVRGLAVAPDDPDRVVIAVGNQWTPRKGIYESQDGGLSWTPVLTAQVYGNETRRATGFVFARDALGRLHFGSAGDGVWVSLDDGATWSARGLTGINITDVKFASDGRGWICAHAWTPHGKSPLAGGLIITRDHGETWSPIAGPAPDELVVAPDGSIVGIFSFNQLQRSTDDGETWMEYSDGLPVDPVAAQGLTSESRFSALAAGPGFLLAGSARGSVYRRGMNDAAWQNIVRETVVEVVEGEPWWGRLQPDVWPHFGAAMGSLVVVPGQPDHWWFTDWYSAYETTDAGRTWVQRIDGIEVTVIHHMVGNPADPARIHVGMADNAYAQSTNGGLRYDTPKKTFSSLKMLAVSPALPGRLYGVGDNRTEWRAEKLWVSVDAGATWLTAPMLGLPPSSQHSMNSIAVHTERPYELVVGVSGRVGEGGGVYRSVDGGRSFSPVNNGLEGAGSLFRYDIWSIGPELAMSRSGHMVAASHETGRVYYHDDSQWRVADVTPGGKPRYLVAAGDLFYLACREGGLLKSEDGGRRWTSILAEQTMVVAADATDPGLIAAATAHRLLISRDGGDVWSEFPLPPQGQVRALAISGPRLHAGTAGGGMFWMALDEAGLLPMTAGETGPGIVPVREDVDARAPDITDGSFTNADSVAQRWSGWTGQGISERSWSADSADDQGGSLRLRSVDGPANTSVGYALQAVENRFNIALAWKCTGNDNVDVHIAVRSYRGGAQVGWQTLTRITGPSPAWIRIEREVHLAEGADRGELVVVLTGEGAVWLDTLSTSIPPLLFGTPR